MNANLAYKRREERMSQRWTEADLAQLATRRAGASRRPPEAKTSKYKAVKTTVDGIVFDSGAEAEHYQNLKLRLKAGEIRNLVLQPRFVLKVKADDAPVTEIVGEYIADFQYEERVPGHGGELWRLLVDDCKGMETLALAKWKQKHLKIQTGIVVREIR